MIVLDTNVLSALMQAKPEPRVVAWMDRQPSQSIWVTSVTVFEAGFGLALLDPGKRRKQLERQFCEVVEEDLDNRILHFDRAAAEQAAELAAARRQSGRTIDMRDTFIAGIVLARKAALATRNTRHFNDILATVVDPWSED